YIHDSLPEVQRRLKKLTERPPAGEHTLDPMRRREGSALAEFEGGFARLVSYLAQNHPEEYAALLREEAQQAAEAEAESWASEATSDAPSTPPAPGKYANLIDIPGFREAAERGQEAIERATRRGKGETAEVQPGDEVLGMSEFVAACLACYRANFDP